MKKNNAEANKLNVEANLLYMDRLAEMEKQNYQRLDDLQARFDKQRESIREHLDTVDILRLELTQAKLESQAIEVNYKLAINQLEAQISFWMEWNAKLSNKLDNATLKVKMFKEQIITLGYKPIGG